MPAQLLFYKCFCVLRSLFVLTRPYYTKTLEIHLLASGIRGARARSNQVFVAASVFIKLRKHRCAALTSSIARSFLLFEMVQIAPAGCRSTKIMHKEGHASTMAGHWNECMRVPLGPHNQPHSILFYRHFFSPRKLIYVLLAGVRVSQNISFNSHQVDCGFYRLFLLSTHLIERAEKVRSLFH